MVLVVRHAAVRNAQRRSTVPPQQLLHDRGDVWQGVPVRKSWQPVGPDDPVELFPGILLDFRVEGKRGEEALERGKLLSSSSAEASAGPNRMCTNRIQTSCNAVQRAKPSRHGDSFSPA